MRVAIVSPVPCDPIHLRQKIFIRYLEVNHEVADDRLAEVLPLYSDIKAVIRWSEPNRRSEHGEDVVAPLTVVRLTRLWMTCHCCITSPCCAANIRSFVSSVVLLLFVIVNTVLSGIVALRCAAHGCLDTPACSDTMRASLRPPSDRPLASTTYTVYFTNVLLLVRVIYRSLSQSWDGMKIEGMVASSLFNYAAEVRCGWHAAFWGVSRETLGPCRCTTQSIKTSSTRETSQRVASLTTVGLDGGLRTTLFPQWGTSLSAVGPAMSPVLSRTCRTTRLCPTLAATADDENGHPIPIPDFNSLPMPGSAAASASGSYQGAGGGAPGAGQQTFNPSLSVLV